MIGVVDASALIRLYIPDGPLPKGFEEFLRGVERSRDMAIAPELLLAEGANVISRKQKKGEITNEESDGILSEILTLPIRLFSHRPLLSRAFSLARKHSLTVYDALYVALAEEQGAVLFSADAEMMKMAARLSLVP